MRSQQAGPVIQPFLTRRTFLRRMATSTLLCTSGGVLSGCQPGLLGVPGYLEQVWGTRGLADGQFQKPRAIAIDQNDRLYIVDMTARIQVFDVEGQFVNGWQTPAYQDGRPSGLSIGQDGLFVADTHYFRVLRYTLRGQLLADRTIGGTQGQRPGEFGFVTDAVQDSAGNIYVAEYGEHDRVQKFSADGDFLLTWGSHGRDPGQFVRPQNLSIDGQDRIWVADACNHRIQVFDDHGNLVQVWGQQGSSPGCLYYPYDLALDGLGHLYVCEFGNHRVQKFTLDGKSLGCFGTHGREEGRLNNPWALVCDSQNRTHILDTNNHRVQRILL